MFPCYIAVHIYSILFVINEKETYYIYTILLVINEKKIILLFEQMQAIYSQEAAIKNKSNGFLMSIVDRETNNDFTG